MDFHEIELQRTMTSDQQLAFQAEYSLRRKDNVVAILLAIFLGGFGAHHFYMGRIGLGVLYLLFCWTLIPTIVAWIECFFLTGRVERYNAQVADEIAVKVRLLSPGTAPNAPVFCTHCGRQITSDSRFCAACGAGVPVPAAH